MRGRDQAQRARQRSARAGAGLGEQGVATGLSSPLTT